MDISVIIVSWNVREKLKENLLALGKSEGSFSFEIFVVDNNSEDETVKMIEDEFPRVKLIANKENLGFAKANNQAIRQARGDYILLLNPDMRVFPDTLKNMMAWMKANQQAWAAGCYLEDENGGTVRHVRRFPDLFVQLAIILKLPHLLPKIKGKYLRVDFDYSQASRVDSVRGAFFIMPKSTISKVGLLDEQYFIWFEEVDYCRRVYMNGGEVWYTPAAKCVDYVAESFRQIKIATRQKFFRDSMLKYFKKWHPRWQYQLLRAAWPAGILITRFLELFEVKNDLKKIRT